MEFLNFRNRKAEQLTLFITMLTATLVSCTQPPASDLDDQLGETRADEFVEVVESASNAGFGNDDNKSCSEEGDVEVCIYSNFNRRIKIEISNRLKKAVEISHSHGFSEATISTFDRNGIRLTPALWEGSPVPGQDYHIPAEGLIPLIFDTDKIEAIDLAAAQAACYQTRVFPAEVGPEGKMLRVCLNRPATR
jgi:hypothetical protein